MIIVKMEINKNNDSCKLANKKQSNKSQSVPRGKPKSKRLWKTPKTK